MLGVAFVAWIGVLWYLNKSPSQRHVEAGDELAQKGQNVEAVKEWEAALQLDPNNAEVQQILGQSYYAGGMWRRSIEHFLALRRLQSDTPHIDAMLASCYLNIGDPRSALSYGADELKRSPNDTLALETCVTAQTRLGDSLEERRFLERLVPLEPQNQGHLMALGELVMNAHDYAECRSLSDRALQSNSDNAEAHALRGISIFFVDGSPDGMRQAESDLQQGLSYAPYAYYCYLYLGRIDRRLAKYTQALDRFKAAIRLDANRADAYYDLASIYELTGQVRQADVMRQRFQSLANETERTLHLRRQIELDPNNSSPNSSSPNIPNLGGR